MEICEVFNIVTERPRIKHMCFRYEENVLGYVPLGVVTKVDNICMYV